MSIIGKNNEKNKRFYFIRGSFCNCGYDLMCANTFWTRKYT